MTLDNQIKKIFHWNTEAFRHMMLMLKNTTSRDGLMMLEVLKAGYVQNAQMVQLMDTIVFAPGNEETEEWDNVAREFEAGLEKRTDVPRQIEASKDPVVQRDLKELEHIYNYKEQKQDEKELLKVDPTWYADFLKREKEKLNGSDENSGTAKG